MGIFWIGAFHLLAVLAAPDWKERAHRLARMGLPLSVALLLLAPPMIGGDWIASIVLAAALVIDGVIRLGIAVVVHVPGWRQGIFIALAQLAGAVGLLGQWPLSSAGNIALALAVALVLSGTVLFRMGLHLRTLPEHHSILHSPIYSTRGWHAHAPNIPPSDLPRGSEQPPLIMYNWTPSGAPNVSMRLPVIDRYFAVPDAEGGCLRGMCPSR